MKSLFATNLNVYAWVLGSIFMRLIFIDITWLSWIALCITLHQFMLIFNAVNHVIPVRYLLGCFMCIQFFLGPSLAYSGLDKYQYFMYRMRIPPDEYFSYIVPAIACFIIGLHISAGKLEGEYVDRERIKKFVERTPLTPYCFIVLGLLASIVARFGGAGLSFIFYLIGSLKFIGLFLLILGRDNLKPVPIILVLGSIISTSFGEGMFHDLLTWLIFTIAVFAIRYKFPKSFKYGGIAVLTIAVMTLQVLKGSYRGAIREGEAGLETFAKLVDEKSEKNSLLSFENLAQSNVRINQGFIITNIMATVPRYLPYEGGTQMYRIFEAALLPRILAPNKLEAGDRTIFAKYSGIRLREGTSMGLSSPGDAYINWGPVGGSIFMFFLGLMYSEILKIFGKQSKTYPVLILFTALVFYYPIRPDCELQTILGHLFKSCFLLFMMISIWKPVFRIPQSKAVTSPMPAVAHA